MMHLNAKPNPTHIYAGKFRDKNEQIRAAGILSYVEGDNIEKTLRMTANSAPSKLPPHIAKYSHYRSPDLGEIRLHYGHANDPKDYETMTHGIHSDEKSFKVKDTVNPKLQTRFEHLKNEMSENVYKSKKSVPLGRIPIGNLPSHINRYEFKFGAASNKSDSVKECVNPDKPRHIVELESSNKHDMYVFSHKDYEPGEQRNRLFSETFDKYKRFGHKTNAVNDGGLTKEALNWLPIKLLEKRAQSDSSLLDDFREKHSHQIGKQIDPNKDTRFVGPDHIFGYNNNNDHFNAGDVLHYRREDKLLKGKERERAFVSTARSALCRLNLVKFKTLVDAFKFYDKNRDGSIDKDELKVASRLMGFSIADDLNELVFKYCDQDGDEKINFVEFCNFLCYKDSMKLGVNIENLNINSNEIQEIKDNDGRILFYSNDLVHKNNIEANELVIRTINSQLDEKVGNWKSTYDCINDAPLKKEPIKKRVYGVPSIRNDIVAPELKKIQDKTNYGNDGNAWSLISPSIFSQHGVYESDFLKPRTKQEIQLIFKKVGYDLSSDLFENTWNTAAALNPYGEVSVEEFRSALDQLQIKHTDSIPA